MKYIFFAFWWLEAALSREPSQAEPFEPLRWLELARLRLAVAC
jgi:hypothetical protein